MAAFSRGAMGFMSAQSFRLPCSMRAGVLAARWRTSKPRIDARLISSSGMRRSPYQAGQAYSFRGMRSADPVLRAVEASGQPVLLYKASPRRLYTLGIYAFGASLIASGLLTWNWRYELPKDLPFFVGPTYVVVGGIMMILGLYVFTAPVNRCLSIEAVPSALGRVQLRITTQTIPVPFFPPKVYISNLGEAIISEKTHPVVLELREADRARKAKVSEGLEGVFIVRRYWEILARKLEQKWTSFFLRFKFAVLRFGNVQLELDEGKYKIDCTGYLKDDGTAIDRLISTY